VDKHPSTGGSIPDIPVGFDELVNLKSIVRNGFLSRLWTSHNSSQEVFTSSKGYPPLYHLNFL
jgi:hypothetical protein